MNRYLNYFARFLCPARLYAYSTKVRLPSSVVDYRKFLVARFLLKNGGSVIDGGAHIGYYTRMFSETLENSRGTVWSFEPNPYIFRLLKKYSRHTKNVVVFQQALSDQNGEVSFYLKPFSLREDSTTEISCKDPCHKKVLVKTMAIDHLIRQGLKNVKLIKLDVEGHELTVLRGAEKTLLNFQPWIIFEYVCYKQRNDSKILSFLAEKNYTVFDLRTLEFLKPHEEIPLTDGIAIPKHEEKQGTHFIKSLAFHH